MEKRRHSIRTKVTLLTMIAVLFSVLSIGAMCILAIKREGDSNTSRQMNLICDDHSKSMDEFLKGVEQSVNVLARYASADISSQALVQGGVVGASGYGSFHRREGISLERRRTLDDYFEAHVNKVGTVFTSVANHTQGVMAYYYRINPEITTYPVGFFYSKTKSTAFTRIQMTDIFAYDSDDVSHVGWYYASLRAGKATWVDPYFNENVDKKMISFVIPIYKANTFIGVIGMDIAYETLVNQVRDIRIFENGYAYLAGRDGEIVYHPDIDPDSDVDSLVPESASTAAYFQNLKSTGDITIPYTYQGEKKEMAFTTLSNGLKLVVVAPEREINESWQSLVNRIVILSLLILAITAIVMTIVMQRITRPLTRLTEASRQMIAGNYDVTLDYGKSDEVGTLTEAYRTLTEHLKIYISDLNSRAYRDALTGIRNKGAYDIFIHKLNDAIHANDAGNPPEFALVMFDCNNLKVINDTYGHDKGDVYLQTACHLICSTFSHSPVFRIGGDEFACVLQSLDYQQRDELFKVFDQGAEDINSANTEPWERVSVSKGIAVFAPEIDGCAEDVLRRADAQMYMEKKRFKMGCQ